LKFLDFPIFLDLTGKKIGDRSPSSREILQETGLRAGGHGICQNPARRGLFLTARYGILLVLPQKRVMRTQEGAAAV
jgi:hypothetical protein